MERKVRTWVPATIGTVSVIVLVVAYFRYVGNWWRPEAKAAMAWGTWISAAGVSLSVLYAGKGRRLDTAWRFGATWGVLSVLGVVLFPVMAGDPPRHVRSCLGQVKQQALALIMYAADNDERLPLSRAWVGAAAAYAKTEFRCPAAASPYTYAMNDSAGALPIWDSDTQTARYDGLVLIFEGNARLPNASGGPEWVAYRHEGKANIAFVDGRAGAFGAAEVDRLWWRP